MAELGVFNGARSKTEREQGPPYKFPEVVGKIGPGEVNLPVEWDKLTPEQQAFQAGKMAIHAAMVSRMDSVQVATASSRATFRAETCEAPNICRHIHTSTTVAPTSSVPSDQGTR